MYSIQKVPRPVVPNLVINFAITLFFISGFCSAQNKNHNESSLNECLTEIISVEIKRHFVSGELPSEKKNYFWFSLNDVLTSFLKEKTKLKFHPKNRLGLSQTEWIMLFNKKEVSFLLDQLSSKVPNFAHLKFPKNFVISNPNEEKEKINGNGLRSAEYYNKPRLFLSYPIILSNKKYALIAYSAGAINSMQGGIHLYKKIDGVWTFYKKLDGWIS